MLVVTKGYLINRQDYGVFDEIITIINEHNLKFTCYCYGTKKINSKNARNLDYGSYIEFEFFYSKDKLSRFKKATIINDVNNEIKKKASLNLINEYFFKTDFDKHYNFYQQCIFYMSLNINDVLLILYMMVNFYKFNGLSIKFNSCNYCGEISNDLFIDFENNFSYCSKCNKNSNLSNQTYNIVFQLFNNNNIDLNQIKKIDVKELKIVIKKMNKSLYKNSGIFLETIKNFL